MAKGGATWSFTYDANGMRKTKTNGTLTYTYLYNGSQLTQMTRSDGNTLLYTYDTFGHPATVNWNDTVYYIITTLQGDVYSIRNSSGTSVVEYRYDPWGKILSITGSMATTLGTLNPLTYRGYVYDHETGLYYLQSRYYNPEWGRFLNADALVATGQGILGNNMFAYCLNNPINYIDVCGNTSEAVQWWTAGMAWLPFVDTVLPVGDIIYGAGIVVLGLWGYSVAQEIPTTTAVVTEAVESTVMEYSEHTNNARKSTKNKHEKGKTRKGRDNRGEKGDRRRVYLGNKKKAFMIVWFDGDLFNEDYGETTYSSTIGSMNNIGGEIRSVCFAVHQIY